MQLVNSYKLTEAPVYPEEYTWAVDSPKITNPVLNTSIQGLSGVDFFNKLLPNLLSLALIIGVIIFTFIIVVGGIQWIGSGGDKQALESARGKILNAIVGLVIILAIIALLRVIGNFFGISLLTLDIGSVFIK